MKLLREPMVQFLLAGAGLLLAQHFLTRATADAARIEISSEQVQAVSDSFRAAQGRAPDARELDALVQRWVDDEVLYRQALALKLDRTDLIVRRELTQKMRFLMEDTTPVADPDENELQQCLAKHPERYGKPGNIDFQQVFLSRRSAADAERVGKTGEFLKQQPEKYAGLGDSLPGGAEWRAQGETELRRNFGNEFATEIAKIPDGQWTGPLRSTLGLHWVRVTARAPFKPSALDEVRQKVMVDCRLAKREAANRKALDGLREHYDIRMPEASS